MLTPSIYPLESVKTLNSEPDSEADLLASQCALKCLRLATDPDMTGEAKER